LRGARLVAVFLRVEIERRLNLAVPQQPCTVLGSTLQRAGDSARLVGDRQNVAAAGEGRGFMAMFA